MASEDLWILGITMTKFGKHPDKDPIDLASEAVLGALGDLARDVLLSAREYLKAIEIARALTAASPRIDVDGARYRRSHLLLRHGRHPGRPDRMVHFLRA